MIMTSDEGLLLNHLEKVRKARETIHYKELFDAVGLHWPGEHKAGVMVGHCSEYAHQIGRHLISALVRNINTDYPGGGFFGLPGIPAALQRTYTNQAPLSSAEMAFVDEETQRVYDDP